MASKLRVALLLLLRRALEPLSRVHSSPSPNSLFRMHNSGHAAATGTFIGWVSADSVCEPSLLRVLHEALDAFPEGAAAVADHQVCAMSHLSMLRSMSCDLVDTDVQVIDANGMVAYTHVMHRPPNLAAMLRNNPGIVAFLYRRACYMEAGPYAEDMQGVEDWLMWARMLYQCGPFIYVPAVLTRYRVHDNRLTARLAPTHEQLKVCQYTLLRHHHPSRSRT